MNLLESGALTIYKQLVKVFSEFVEQAPGTGMGRTYRRLLDIGLKCVPKDKRALAILGYVLGKSSSSPTTVQDLNNMNFSELPITIRPVYKSVKLMKTGTYQEGTRQLTAFYNRDGRIYSRIIDLLDLEGSGKAGIWTDEKGDKVTLLDLE